MSARVFHGERAPALLQPFVSWWRDHGPFDIVCTSGNRDDTMQLLEWAKGRKRLPDGSWMVTDPGAVVTYAQTAAASGHGHGGAADFHPVREVAKGGWVTLIYLGSKKLEEPEVYAEGIRRFIEMAQLAEDHCDLESGRHFPDPDLPHLQVHHWRDLPLVG